MSPAANVSALLSFLSSVQFYSKFIQNLSILTEPITHLTRKDMLWIWDAEEQAAFQRMKGLLCTDILLAHFDPALQIDISYDNSNVGVGVMLFHQYIDVSEYPIANASKTLMDT